MQPAETPKPTTGMWAPYEPPEIGEPLDTLDKVGPFVLLQVHVREGVATSYGPRDAADLTVATTETGVVRTFSGFAAGVVGMCKRVGDGDLPAVCRIVETQAGRGKTRWLELVQLLPAGADVAAIAKAQPVPIAAIVAGATHDELAHELRLRLDVDDDIPY